MTLNRQRLAAAMVVLGLTASPAFAQKAEPSRSFRELGQTLRVGDSIVVTMSDGQLLRGRVVDLTIQGLTFEGSERRSTADQHQTVRQITEAEVSRIARNDSLKNGVGAGMAAAGLAMFLPLLTDHPRCSSDSVSASWTCIGVHVAAASAAGGLAGALVDSLVMQRIYVAAQGTVRASVAPILSREHVGVGLTLRF